MDWLMTRARKEKIKRDTPKFDRVLKRVNMLCDAQ